MSENSGEPKFFYGPKGKTLFSGPFVTNAEMRDWNSEVPGSMQQVEKTGDERSYTILASAMVEYHVNRILELIMPDFKNRSFGLKLNLLKSLNLIPEHLLTSAELILKVRNKFAHDMKLHKLNELNEDIRKRLRKAHQDIFGQTNQTDSLKDMFKLIFQMTFMGIRLYEPNIRLLVETIRSEKFHEELRQTAMKDIRRLVTMSNQGVIEG